jgi:hypothetical protein
MYDDLNLEEGEDLHCTDEEEAPAYSKYPELDTGSELGVDTLSLPTEYRPEVSIAE